MSCPHKFINTAQVSHFVELVPGSECFSKSIKQGGDLLGAKKPLPNGFFAVLR